MSCCTQTLDLGCFASCDVIDIFDNTLPFPETFDLKAHNGVVTVESTSAMVNPGNPIQIDTSSGKYNRGFTYRVEVFDSSGVKQTDTVNLIVYDCWTFTLENTH